MIGKWVIEENRPYGFVVKNTDESSRETEYHFFYDSNGWITARNSSNNPVVLGAFGPMNLQPVLVDKQSTKNQERVSELRKKGFSLTEEESKELLKLCGLIKEK